MNPLNQEECENAIIRDPTNINVWLNYLCLKKNVMLRPIRKAIFERALHHLPKSYKLWKMYLLELISDFKKCKICDIKKNELETRMTFKRALKFQLKMPSIWLEFANFLQTLGYISKTRETFDLALKNLPVTQHDLIWKHYLDFIDKHPTVWKLGVYIYPRYLQFQPNDQERYISYLVHAGKNGLAIEQLKSALLKETSNSCFDNTACTLWHTFVDIIDNFPLEIKYNEIIPIVDYVLKISSEQFPNEHARFLCILAKYFTKQNDFYTAERIYERGVNTSTNIPDFTYIYDAFLNYFEETISVKMNIFDAKCNNERSEQTDTESSFYTLNVNSEYNINDIDLQLSKMESLLESRLLLCNSVLIRKNPHDCTEWIRRAEIFNELGKEDKVILTFQEAIKKIEFSKAYGDLVLIYIKLARMYEKKDDIIQAQKTFELALKIPFKIDELVKLVCSWAEMELRLGKFNESLDLVKSKLNGKLAESNQLWSLYIDLEELVGTLETVRAAYDHMIELKVVTPIHILNYAALLKENDYFNDMFKIFEKGISLFPWPHVEDIWLNYLDLFIKIYKDERLYQTRNLFDRALKNAPTNNSRTLYLLLANMEEEWGDPNKALKAISDLCDLSPNDKKFECYLFYIVKAEELSGIMLAREVYEKALRSLTDLFELYSLCLNYSAKELLLGEIDRSRAIFEYGSQFADPSIAPKYWSTWNDFEMEYGNAETLRKMLRTKRTISSQFNPNLKKKRI